MKISVNYDGQIELEEVFNSIILRTNDGETMSICMRDSGFELTYQGDRYNAKHGIVLMVKKQLPKDVGAALQQREGSSNET